MHGKKHGNFFVKQENSKLKIPSLEKFMENRNFQISKIEFYIEFFFLKLKQEKNLDFSMALEEFSMLFSKLGIFFLPRHGKIFHAQKINFPSLEKTWKHGNSDFYATFPWFGDTESDNINLNLTAIKIKLGILGILVTIKFIPMKL